MHPLLLVTGGGYTCCHCLVGVPYRVKWLRDDSTVPLHKYPARVTHNDDDDVLCMGGGSYTGGFRFLQSFVSPFRESGFRRLCLSI